LITDIREEVEIQARKLSVLAKARTPSIPTGSLLVGAGDSYVAAQCSAFLSSFRCIAIDPYTLISAPGLSKNRAVVFISVSGRTRSNVTAAEKVKPLAERTIAVTADSASPLAKVTSEVTLIPYDYRPRTPGTLSFTLSLLATLKLASAYTQCDFPQVFEQAATRTPRLRVSKDDTTFFLGNHAAFAIAQYATAKTYEIFGSHAQGALLEEFSHMELFSLRKKDTVNVFQTADPAERGERLVDLLRERGYSAALIERHGTNEVEEVFHAVFVVQLAILRQMKERGIITPSFVKSHQRLEVSDMMIY
jgi:glucosamine 6-phosphate synthetase-like amidotransferase/phosphosugar isomerase protein